MLSGLHHCAMSHHDEVSAEAIQKLSAAGIDYMIVGSHAMFLYGEPRATQDIDIVIEATFEQVEAFASLLNEDQYVSLDAARSAVERKSMFNVIDTTSGWKIDLILRKSRAYDEEAFRRRRKAPLLGQDVWVLSAEDAILSKLEWARKGDSERQLRDAESIAVIQWDNLDLAYLRRWAGELRVTQQLDSVIEHAQQLQEGAQ
jgi:hypothetical protein